MAKRAILSGIVVAAAAVTALSGCSDSKPNTTSNPPAAAGNKVVIDGQNQNVNGPVTCTQVAGNLSIGIGDPSTGIGAVVTNADPPVVQAVGLGNLTGVTLGYSAGAPNQANAQATKTGNSYTIKGTATGANAANPQQVVSKSFEMDVTCP